MSTYDSSLVTVIPDTYKSYNFGVRMIIKPVYDQLQVIENEIKTQGTILLIEDLLTIFKHFRINLHPPQVSCRI